MNRVEVMNNSLLYKLQKELEKYPLSKTDVLPLRTFLNKMYEVPEYAELWYGEAFHSINNELREFETELIKKLANRYVLEQRLVVDYCFKNLIIVPLYFDRLQRLLQGDYMGQHITESIVTDGEITTKSIHRTNKDIKNVNVYHPSFRERVDLTSPGEFFGSVSNATYILKRTISNDRVIGLQLRTNELSDDIIPILELAKKVGINELMPTEQDIKPYIYIRKRG